MSYHFGTSDPQNVQMLLSGVTLGPPELGLRVGPCPVDGCKEPPWGILGVGVGETPLASKIDDWVASSPRRDEVFDRLWRRRRPKSLIADVGRFRICSRLVPIVCVEGLVAEPSGVGGGKTFVSVAGILVCAS